MIPYFYKATAKASGRIWTNILARGVAQLSFFSPHVLLSTFPPITTKTSQNAGSGGACL